MCSRSSKPLMKTTSFSGSAAMPCLFGSEEIPEPAPRDGDILKSTGETSESPRETITPSPAVTFDSDEDRKAIKKQYIEKLEAIGKPMVSFSFSSAVNVAFFSALLFFFFFYPHNTQCLTLSLVIWHERSALESRHLNFVRFCRI